MKKQNQDPKDNQNDSSNDDQKDDQKKDDNQNDKSSGNQPDEDIKNLQRKLSEKDVLLKQSLENLKNLEANKQSEKSELQKSIDSLQNEVKGMSDIITIISREKKVSELSEKYPDILPDLLVDKKDDEIEKIVEKQRKISKKLYGDSREFHQPTYSSIKDVDKEVDEIKKDKKTSGEQSALKVIGLNRLKTKFTK